MKVSNKAANLVGSEIIKLAAEVNALKAQGQHVYNLTIGDFNPQLFPIPQELNDAIVQAYQEGQTNYPPSNGVAELRETVSEFLQHREGLSYDANDILIACGARPLIYAVYQALLNPGEKVIFPVPSWNNNHYTHLSDAQKVMLEVGPENNFMPTAADIEPHIQEAALIAVCSPLNPTGTTFRKDQLEAICDLIIAENERRGPDQKPVYLLFDQIYWMLTYGETEHINPVGIRPEMKKYTLFIDGLSKAFAATGVRVGWGFGPSEVIGRMKAILGHIGAWAPRAEQVACSRYLKDHDSVDRYVAEIKKKLFARLNGFYDGFMDLKAKGFAVDAIAPQAAIYLTIRFDLNGKVTPDGKTITGVRDIASYLIQEAKLAVVPFYAFGAGEEEGWFRLSVGTAVLEEIPDVFAGLEKALAALT